MDRKKRLKYLQASLLLLGIIILVFTYLDRNKQERQEVILSKETKKKISEEIKKTTKDGKNVFYNIEYSGFDLSGNRYVLKSKKATTKSSEDEKIYMDEVYAVFYFKDDTVLYVQSKSGLYNSQTQDMNFYENVNAKYENSELFAGEAEYSNSDGYLSITKNVKINDSQGKLIADKLLFDLNKKTLNISAFDNDKINAKIKLDEKRF